MRSFCLVAVAALIGSVASSPLGWFSRRASTAACMSRSDAAGVVEVYRQLIANYTDTTAQKYCADAFKDVSDSINTFLHQPFGQPTFPTKKDFIEAQEYNPPFPLVVQSVDAVDCASIALQWTATFGDAQMPSKGITIIKTTNEKGWWQILEIDVEFNSLNWLLDMGGNYTWDG